MPTIIDPSELPPKVALRVLTDCGAEEKRSAMPPEEDDTYEDATLQHDCSPTSDDERSATIPTTAELEPLEDASPATIQFALQSLVTHEDWLRQHEAITTLRRAIVHDTVLLSNNVIEQMLLPGLMVASDNLRSALSKNALLALTECFEYLGLIHLRIFLLVDEAYRSAPLVDVLLRRATCEKRFLRDAAHDAIDCLLLHLASPELIKAAASYASNKNAKIVALASKIMAQSFAYLRARSEWDVEPFGKPEARDVYAALVKFRAGKDSAARTESLACLRLLGEALGHARFDETLQHALSSSQRHSIASIVAEVFPPVVMAPVPGRRGSLRDRVLLQQTKTTE